MRLDECQIADALIEQILSFETRIGLKSPVENTWPRCSYPELTMHSGSQLTCSELLSAK